MQNHIEQQKYIDASTNNEYNKSLTKPQTKTKFKTKVTVWKDKLS